MNDPFKVFDEIRSAYLRYLDSPFRLRYDALLEERRVMLDADRQLYRQPLFEAVPPYESSNLTFGQACATLGISPEAADFADPGLFPARRLLHRHQFEAIRDSRASKAVVVTSGTGSGKTECFLLPIFASLVEESGRTGGWGPVAAPDNSPPWWEGRSNDRAAQRRGESSQRPAAIRALLLYPLNALVEDQLGRIREACDSRPARDWLAAHRPGHRFWFGRYTGATPVAGEEQVPAKRADLKRRLKQVARDWSSAVASAAANNDPKILNYFQDPDGSEMWSRWDMQDSPPDILITNYSMLNIMLMRGVEEDMFEKTRDWLRDSRNVFHLVVDELHSYRGTPGTEVAYLLRALLSRLGLTPDSPQLRIISTSASISSSDSASLDYLEQFFGRPRSGFSVIDGYRASFPAGSGLASTHPTFRAFDNTLASGGIGPAAAALAASAGLQAGSVSPERLLADTLERVGALAAVKAQQIFTADDIAIKVFGQAGSNGAQSAKGLIRSLIRARKVDPEGREVAPLPLRVHYFFHNTGRIWACVNPGCSGRTGTTPSGAEPPPVGRLYTEPRPRCDSCSARVLELLYCQPCGEVYFGGFKREDANSPGNAWHLSPDFPELDRVPDKSASLKRKCGDYLVFWPANGRSLVKQNRAGPRWIWTETSKNTGGLKTNLQWTGASLEHADGRLSVQVGQAARQGMTHGFMFLSPDGEVNSFPSKCAHCGADWRHRRIASPVRDLGSGFQRTVQLLCDALMREMPDARSRKLVLFSDSRQDAAKLSTGIKRFHYFDVVRQLASEELQRGAAGAAAAYQAAVRERNDALELLALEQKRDSAPLADDERRRRQALMQTLPLAVSGAVAGYASGASSQPPAVLTLPAAPGPFISLRFNPLLDAVRSRLLAIGINPGGPGPLASRYVPRGANDPVSWTGLFDWSAVPRGYRSGLQPVERQLMETIEGSLREAVVEDVLFADGSRDFESLRLGFLWVRDVGPAAGVEEAAASVLRMLAQRRRWTGSDREGQAQAPGYITTYLTAVSPSLGLSAQDLEARVRTVLGPALDDWWIIDPVQTQLITPRPDAAGTVATHSCRRCSRTHLHPSGGVCTGCSGGLTAGRHPVSGIPADYYEFLARCQTPPFRLMSEELTGQTDKADRLARQRKFQDVFMQDEIADAEGVDLLSVTTTMEAGVDIGALQGIGMANMPPVRFNYQQRIGRAGRRGLGMSAALTLCRGRSHDDYYFERPKMIVSDPPPRPYVDVTRAEIARRVVAKEVLRRAFQTIVLPDSGDSVHGEFGTVRDWSAIHRPAVAGWIAANAADVADICRTILRQTPMDTAAGRAAMAAFVAGGLIPEMDRRAAAARPETALSEQLASDGLLPMFGFPTRVRYLFHQLPRAQGTWPPERGVIDRELEIAISQFAPGSQTVKDDKLHTAVGVVDYRPSAQSVAAQPNPLGNPVPVGICRRCQGLVEAPAAQGGCPYCAAVRNDKGYRTAELIEPPGFTTWFGISERAEFTGGFEFTPRALRSRMGSVPRTPAVRRNFTVDASPGRIYRINDNDGSDFTFVKVNGQNVWITHEAFQQALQDLPENQRVTMEQSLHIDASAGSLQRALAALLTTDVMTVGISTAPAGLSLNPAVPEGRAAWYSFGFLLRRAASVRLDVAEDELELGIQPVLDPSIPFAPPSARIFLSDTLENGAGYSTKLGTPAEFEDLLHFLLGQLAGPDAPRSQAYFDPIVAPAHEAACASSCHRCLREFGNMAFHPLLDWRMALDMARLALDSSAQIDLRHSYWASLVARTSGPFFAGLGLQPAVFGTLQGGIDVMQRKAVILSHPLWDRDPANMHHELAAAFADAEHQGFSPVACSLFRAVRFPYEYAEG